MLGTSLYVMWSARRQLSKVGIASSPPTRCFQIRREKDDDTIKLITSWNVEATGIFFGLQDIEISIHQALCAAGFQDRSNPFPSEWFEMRWPAIVQFIEQWAQLYAGAGLRMVRMPGVHGASVCS